MVSKWFCQKEALDPRDSTLKPKEKFQERFLKESEENTKQLLFVNDIMCLLLECVPPIETKILSPYN